jgi:serine/threonine-protein kinase PBS1
LDGSEKEDSPRETAKMLNRDLDRERAVAEAKMWGEKIKEQKKETQKNRKKESTQIKTETNASRKPEDQC